MNQQLSDENIKKIALEYGRVKGATKLSEELGVSKQRVQQIVQKLKGLGIFFPAMKDKKYKGIVEELKIENPELFKQNN